MTDKNTAVDFNDAESIEAELAAAATVAAPVKDKVKKIAKPRVITITHIADKAYAAGDEIVFDFEVPKSAGGRGIVSGIELADMTTDQLRIEYRNANSVAYKAAKANKNPDTIAKSKARLEAVKAEMEVKGIQPTARGAKVEINAATIAEMITSGKVSVEEIQALLNGAQ